MWHQKPSFCAIRSHPGGEVASGAGEAEPSDVEVPWLKPLLPLLGQSLPCPLEGSGVSFALPTAAGGSRPQDLSQKWKVGNEEWALGLGKRAFPAVSTHLLGVWSGSSVLAAHPSPSHPSAAPGWEGWAGNPQKPPKSPSWGSGTSNIWFLRGWHEWQRKKILFLAVLFLAADHWEMWIDLFGLSMRGL